MSETQNQVRSIFLHAVENYPPERWEGYLDEVCRDDPDLRGRVKALLEADQKADSLLDSPGPPASGLGATASWPGPPAEDPGTVIGPYKLLEVLGEGGMGVVYMAEQQRPVRRRVALKLIKPGMDTRQVIARFEAERQALALMDHPSIAKVLDAGATERGRPYFVMELVRGVPITTYCDTVHLTPRDRLELFIPVCQAIQHAHQKGIVHRDLKPSNVLVTMVDGKPVPKVIDFGVAKAIDQRLTERTMFTQHGAIVGTFEYMSPEQAELSGLDIDTRSDIYALGVLLYELLAGSTPLERERVRQAAYSEIIRLIREEEPAKPSTRLSDSSDRLASLAAQRRTDPARLARQVRGELDWIVMKALDKDRTRRYETASGLARDIRRHLDGDPVEAGPPSTWYRLRKFGRKHRAALVIMGAFAAVLLIAATVGTYLAIRATNAERLAIGRLEETNRAKADTEAALGRETESRALAQRRQAEAEDGRRLVANLLARSQIERGVQRLNEGSALGLFDLVDAHATAAQDATLREAAARLWSIWSAGEESRLLQILDGGRGLAFSPDGSRLATTEGDTVHLWDVTAGWHRGPSLRHEGGTGIGHVAFSPDGKLLVTAASGGDVRLWKIATGRVHGEPIRSDDAGRVGSPTTVAFSPNGQLLAIGFSDGTVRFWDPATGRPHGRPIRQDAALLHTVFSPDGRILVTGSADSTVRLWNMATGALIGAPLGQFIGNLFAIEVSPDGKLLAVADHTHGKYIHIFETESGRRHCELRMPANLSAQQGWVGDLEFSPDSKRLASASLNWTASLWDTETGQIIGEPMRHGGRVNSLRFSPDGRLLASIAQDGLVRLWDAETQQLHGFPLPHPGLDPARGSARASAVEFSPDGTMLAAGFGTTTRVWRMGPGPTARTYEHDDDVLAVDLSRDGRLLATGTRSDVRIWENETGRPVLYPVPEPFRAMVAFSPDGRMLAVSESVNRVGLLDSATGRPIGRPLVHGIEVISALAFSADSKRLGTSTNNWITTKIDRSAIRLWDASTRELLAEQPGETLCMAFSLDGCHLAAGYLNWVAKTWNLADGLNLARELDVGEQCTAINYSTDGRWLAAGTGGGFVHLFDPTTGQVRGPAIRLGGQVSEVKFSPDGKLLATASRGQPARLWDLTLGSPYLAIALPQTANAVSVAFSADGRRLAIGSEKDGKAHLLQLWEPPATSHEMRLRTWVALGTRMVQGELAPIPLQEWQALRHESGASGNDSPARGDRRYQRALSHLRLGHKLGKLEEAGDAYHRAIALLEELKADDPLSSAYRHDLSGAYSDLGDLHAERSKWDAAITSLSRAIALGAESDPNKPPEAPSPQLPFPILQRHALACLGVGDRAGYRATCGRLLREFGGQGDPQTLSHLAWVCALAPESGTDSARFVSLAGVCPDEPSFMIRHGAALYRAGRYAKAVRRLEASIAAQGRGGTPLDWLFLAMAHQRLGHAAEAKAWLDKGVRGVERDGPGSGGVAPMPWGDRLARDLLRREAEALLTDTAFPADPFAPAR
jgi:WD40 repeat protein/serine/threonine protein kinase/tetratricopeptide (TPR) repeat protein